MFRLGHAVCASNRLFRGRRTDQMIEKLLEIAIRIASRANTLEGGYLCAYPSKYELKGLFG